MDSSEKQSYEAAIGQATAYARKLLDASVEVVGRADGIVDKTARDPEIVALTLLCRTISNFHAVMNLVQNQGVVEARAIVRLIYENVLWIGALQERGAAFVQDMLDDEAHNRKALAQLTFSLSAKSGLDNRGEDALHLRTLLKEMDKQFPGKKKLSAAQVAASGRIETAYFEYGRFSLDAVHCSVTALGRHISGSTVDTRREITIDVVPNTPPREVLSTIISACKGLIYAVVGANGLLCLDKEGDVCLDKKGDAFAKIIAEFEAANWHHDLNSEGLGREGV